MRSWPVLLLLPALLTCDGRASPAEPADVWQDSPRDSTAVPRVRFEDYFTDLAIEDAGTGQRGLYDGQLGYRFSRKARLQLAYASRQACVLGVSVESLTTRQVVGTWSRVVNGEIGVVTLGLFPRDFYMLRAFVGPVQVAEIQFASE